MFFARIAALALVGCVVLSIGVGVGCGPVLAAAPQISPVPPSLMSQATRTKTNQLLATRIQP